MKQEAGDEMRESQGASSFKSSPHYHDPRLTMRTMREGTSNWYSHMDTLFATLQNDLEVILSRSP